MMLLTEYPNEVTIFNTDFRRLQSFSVVIFLAGTKATTSLSFDSSDDIRKQYMEVAVSPSSLVPVSLPFLSVTHSLMCISSS